MKLLLLLPVMFVAFSSLPLRAAQIPPPEVSLPLTHTPPTVDGIIEEAEWAGASRSIGLVSQYDGLLGAREAIIWVGADRSNLYLAMKSELPPSGDLLTRAVPDGNRDLADALHDDTIELVLAPHLGATQGDRRYFHIIFNDRQAMYDRSLDPASPQNPVNMAWRLPEWTYRSSLREGWWHVEIAIPFTALGATAEDLGRPWGIRFCRNWQRGWDQSRWESVLTAYEDLPTIPRVTFDERAPVVQVLGLRGETGPRLELSISNPGAVAIPVKVFVSDTWSRNPPHEIMREMTVAAGAIEHVVVTPPHGGPEGAHHTILRVTSPDEQRIFYLRDFSWKFEVPAERWTIIREDKQAVRLQYKIYPYYRKLKVRVSLAGLATKDKVTGAELAFSREGNDRTLARAPLTFRQDVAETLLEVPELTAGRYLISVRLQGEGVPTDPVTQVYERKVFPWEHNNLGLSERVIPPFTPIRVVGNTVSTVLRDHRLGNDGLWQQVTSLGRPLLKSPMRWVVWGNGEVLPVKPGSLSVDSAKPHAAVTTGAFSAGPVQARVRTEWDYDGMAKVFLRLAAAPGQQVERLSLEIPLDDAQVPYMHACGDGLHYNYAGKTPPGTGAIWDSSQANRTNLVNTFYPYLWLGGGERGLCWFADTDKDWSLDDTTPTIELERQAGVLLLRVNFITRPTLLDRPREIVFGLQATPAKPMPEQPVNWRRWFTTPLEGVPNLQLFTIVGASYYYGCLSYDFYPINRNFEIYEVFSRARDTGEVPPDFLDRWMEQYKQYVSPDSDEFRNYRIHVQSGLGSATRLRRAEGWLWTPYTNIRGMGNQQEEWPVFQDEWVNLPYLERATRGDIAYDVTAVRSWQDAALWYYREMMKCFDGVYWDNIFLAANFDTVAGGAWVDEQGRLHPSLGLWAQREMVKRTAVLFNEMGRPVFANVAHMTNTNLVPVLSFATVNLDWEWQYGKRDFQDRFSPELTVAEAIGRQCGNIPLILAGGFYDAKDPDYAWCMRTRTGVCLVHEILAWDWGPAERNELYKRLYLFGYGEKDCRVYNYWDEGFPLQIEGCEAKGLVMVRGQRAVMAVTDYSGGGEVTLRLDLKTTGLPDMVKPSDLETGEALASPAPGVVTFPLKKHDYKVVLLE